MRLGTSLLMSALAAACASPPPLRTVDSVELGRFMGDWYVIAHIPAGSEERAFNAVESYELIDGRTVATTYAFRDGSFEGPIEELHPTGRIRNPVTNAAWGMDFLWPIQFEYLITWIDPAYETAIIARTARDYAWIMARTPEIDEGRYVLLVDALREQGYEVERLRRVPQRWPDAGHPADRSITASRIPDRARG